MGIQDEFAVVNRWANETSLSSWAHSAEREQLFAEAVKSARSLAASNT
jgi:antibiotic biosynthesis monooxygenase (ABM) superfamily enzyme